MDAGDPLGDDGREAGWISPDDRLWRHPSEVDAPPPRRKRRGGSDARLWTVAVLAAVIASMLTSGLIVVSGGFDREPIAQGDLSVVRPSAPQTAELAASTQIEHVAEALRPSIVYVGIERDGAHTGGSGVAFRADGHILTNQHLVDGARAITVTLPDGQQVDAKLVGSDADTDIAVVKIDGVALPPARLGSATALKVGQMAIAIGEPNVTTGVVSAVGRQVDHTDGVLLDVIQTDAPISPRCSGGALVDAAGNVIGITTAVVSVDAGNADLGYAIPIDIARDVATQLIDTGHVVHVWLGIEGEDLDSTRANEMKVPGGAVVKGVQANSPAARGGLAVRDVILSLDGRAVTTMAGLVVALRTRKPGESIKLRVRRDGVNRTVVALLAERPATIA